MLSAPERPPTSSKRVQGMADGRPCAPRRPPSPARPPAGAAHADAASPSVSGKRVALHRRTYAHQVAIAVGAVYTAHGGPHFVLARPRRGKRRALARIGALPAVGD